MSSIGLGCGRTDGCERGVDVINNECIIDQGRGGESRCADWGSAHTTSSLSPFWRDMISNNVQYKQEERTILATATACTAREREEGSPAPPCLPLSSPSRTQLTRSVNGRWLGSEWSGVEWRWDGAWKLGEWGKREGVRNCISGWWASRGGPNCCP